MKQVKHMELLREGCLKLTLSSGKEFDPYMLQLMRSNAFALMCERKQRGKTVFYYDVSERLSLQEVLRLCVLSQKEACALLELMMRSLLAVQRDLPVYAQVNTIFFDPLIKNFAFVVLPIHDHVYENDWSSLLAAMLKELRIQGDSLYGCLFRLTRKEDLNSQQILDFVRLWRKQHTWRFLMSDSLKELSYLRQRKAENAQAIQKEMASKRFCTRFVRWNEQGEGSMEAQELHPNDTVLLFPSFVPAYLRAEKGERYPLKEKTLIGQGADCDMVLNEPEISFHHTLLTFAQGKMHISDLDSQSGTMCNGLRIPKGEEIVLHGGDMITIGAHTWVYEEGAV